MTTILCVGAILFWVLMISWIAFMLVTTIRDDRRNEKARKERLAREAELQDKLNH